MSSIIAVARKAGVSPATVSRYFNSPEIVREETRQRIYKAVRELGYTPNPFAQGLVTGKSGVIAVVVPDIANPGFDITVRGCSDELDKQGKTLCVYNCDQPHDENRIRAAVERQQADGVIVASQEEFSRVNAEGFYHAAVPTVFIDRTPVRESTDALFVDNRRATNLVCEHLAALGHKHLGTVTGNLKTLTGRERLQYFLESAAAHGMSVADAHIFRSDFKFLGGAEAARQLAGMPNPPTALFAANDLMAIGLMTELTRFGWKLPEQLSVVGCLDIWASAITTPALTTVRVSSYSMGREAARLLMERIREPERPGVRHIFPVELVVRGSTGRPAERR